MELIELPSGIETKAFALGERAIDDLPEVLNTFFPNKKALLIADGNTWEAAGKRVNQVLTESCKADVCDTIIYGKERLHPESSLSDTLCETFLSAENIVPVAVGSGVINDVVKCAAGKAGIPYCCVPTAASVDGYTAFFGDLLQGERIIFLQKLATVFQRRPSPSALNVGDKQKIAHKLGDQLIKILRGALPYALAKRHKRVKRRLRKGVLPHRRKTVKLGNQKTKKAEQLDVHRQKQTRTLVVAQLHHIRLIGAAQANRVTAKTVFVIALSENAVALQKPRQYHPIRQKPLGRPFAEHLSANSALTKRKSAGILGYLGVFFKIIENHIEPSAQF